MRPIRSENSASLTEPATAVLSLDIGIDATRVKFLETDQDFHRAPLMLPADGRPLITTRERRGSVSLSGSPKECLGALLTSANAELPLKQYAVNIGHHEDPLLPFGAKFESTLRFIDQLLRCGAGHLTVATRSPLIIAAASIFCRERARSAVIIAVETHKDAVGRRCTPTLPRPSERLRAAKAMRKLGIDVTIQVSPLLPRVGARERAVEMAEALVATGCQILVTALQQVAAPGEYPAMAACSEFGHFLLCEELTRRGYRGHRLDPLAGVGQAA